MLTGELPIGRFAPPSQKVQVDVRLDDVVLRSLEKDVLRRYQHASEIKSDMDSIAGQPVIAAVSAPPLPPAASSKVAPAHLSHTALCGAIWSAVGMIAAIGLAIGFFVVHEARPARLGDEARSMSFAGMLIALPLLMAAASAPFGTTICGAVALAQIKRSEGKLYGLRLAAADLFFYPTLVVFCLLVIAIIFLVKSSSIRAGPAEIVFLAVASAGVFAGLAFAFRGLCRSAIGAKKDAGKIARNPAWWRYWRKNAAIWGGILFIACIVRTVLNPGADLRGAAIGFGKQQPIFYTFHGVTDFAKGPDGPVLSDAFIKKSGFTPAQVGELNKIIGAHYREFVSIERRHTDVSKDDHGHVIVKIAPFPDESLALAQRLSAELRGVLGRKVMPQEPKDPDELRSIGLFRHRGVAEVTAELWKDGAVYNFKEKHGSHSIPGGTSGGASRGASGKDWKAVFPEEYQVYWTEQE